MSPRLRQRTALLLAAVLALLPLRAIEAALGHTPAAGDATLAHHHGQHMAAMPDCPMHPQAGGHAPGGKHCSGGCDLCGACTATLPAGLQLSHVTFSLSLRPALQAWRTDRPVEPLFRPPRT